MVLSDTAAVRFLSTWLRQDFDRNKVNVVCGSWVALFAHPLYYLFCTYVLVGFYDSAVLRFGSAILALPIIYFQTRATEYQKPWLNLYWYAWMIFTLPVTFTYILLANHLTPMWLICETMMIFIAMILTGSFPLVLIVLGIGMPIACVSFTLYTGQPLPWGYEFWTYLAPMPMVLISGVIFTASTKKSVALYVKKAMSGLAASIAHEMRNPLGQVKYSMDQVEHRLPIPSSLASGTVEMDVRDVNALYSEIASGKQAIKRGLQVIEMTLNEVSGKPLDPAKLEYAQASQLVQKAIDEFSFESPGERAKVSVNVVTDFVFKVDETRFVFVLFNLLKNSLYYFKLNPSAMITITVDKSRVVFKDTGPGIQPDVLTKLFDDFVTSDKEGGTGLGLSFCKRTMKAFGGDITCASVLGKSTEFTLQFPIVSQAEWKEHESKTLITAHQIFSGTRILVVDDLTIMRKATRELLDGLGCTLDEAANGVEAIDKLRKTAYDLVVLDLNMPVLDGYATAERIRAGVAPWNRQVPILAYTTESAYMAKVKTEKVGMNAFVSKPCNRLEFIKTAQGAIANAASKAVAEEALDNVLEGKVILIADDQPLNRKIVAKYLEPYGVSVVQADHGRAVVDVLESGELVDAILMDMHMPGMGGVEAATEIRKNKAFDVIPILALTANFSQDCIEETNRAGMNGFISKPVDIEELREKLSLAIKSVGRRADSKGLISSGIKPSSILPVVTPLRSKQREWTPVEQMARNANSTTGSKLLDLNRLDEILRISGQEFLAECVTSYFQKIRESFAAIQEHIANKDFGGFNEAMHTLVGSSGQAGAFALHQYLRNKFSHTVNQEREWLQQEWLSIAQYLFEQTQGAMFGSYLSGVSIPVQEEVAQSANDA